MQTRSCRNIGTDRTWSLLTYQVRRNELFVSEGGHDDGGDYERAACGGRCRLVSLGLLLGGQNEDALIVLIDLVFVVLGALALLRQERKRNTSMIEAHQ
jgi:hypothetical protein